jgi:polyribonucleotide nucleotidyltransferase
VIRGIVEETGAKVDINDDGTIKIAGSKKEIIDAAIARIKGITLQSRKSARSIRERSLA